MQRSRKIGKRKFSLKSPKKGESKLKANIRATQLRKEYKYVRILKTDTYPVLHRVYAVGKKRK